MKKNSKTPFAIAMSATLLPFTAIASQANDNPFALSDLSTGYMQTAEAEKDGAAKMPNGACGEGKCGGNMQKKATDTKAIEGKCAGNKPVAPATPGDDSKKMEGNCGANMKSK